ncbi:hypothetical protein OS493_016583 [Desmophyllum pertusum]|uniref:Uncharacterized protein n=1 Tax=Desmophyllum pertusum TaxID=174260 RepID=A0A9X0CZM5_9CNID|nr:hypothetical protein OS493_016583 [Desmophyllum pertusum]
MADINQKLKTAKTAVPDTTNSEKQLEMAETEWSREMAELSKRRKEIDQTKATLAASKREADETRQTMAAETKHCGRETEKKRKQFTVWRVKGKRKVNDKDNELDDLNELLTELQNIQVMEILPPKQSSRLTRRFNRLLRRH